mmetsp:Transcript_9208/g.23074  ORF Transcript_9208/g.23074 Transcript_9208/m.23074 type:complete len:274 (-) Transcript_9208:462-1283(-)
MPCCLSKALGRSIFCAKRICENREEYRLLARAVAASFASSAGPTELYMIDLAFLPGLRLGRGSPRAGGVPAVAAASVDTLSLSRLRSLVRESPLRALRGSSSGRGEVASVDGCTTCFFPGDVLSAFPLRLDRGEMWAEDRCMARGRFLINCTLKILACGSFICCMAPLAEDGGELSGCCCCCSRSFCAMDCISAFRLGALRLDGSVFLRGVTAGCPPDSAIVLKSTSVVFSTRALRERLFSILRESSAREMLPRERFSREVSTEWSFSKLRGR